MILTHGANSIVRKPDLTDFIVLSYGKQDGNNNILCDVGTASVSDVTEWQSVGLIDTPFGKMHFVQRNANTPANELKFSNTDISLEWLKTHAYQVECVCKLDSSYYFFRFMYSALQQDYFQRNNNSGVNTLAMVIRSNTWYTTDKYNGSYQSNYSYSGGEPGERFTKVCTKTMNYTGEFHHVCTTVDFPNKKIMAWVDGVLCWVIHLDDYIINWYKNLSSLLSFMLCSGDRVSQMCVRKAIWTEEINYTPPTEPYVI